MSFQYTIICTYFYNGHHATDVVPMIVCMVSALPIPIPIYIKAKIRKKQDELTKEFRDAHQHGSSTLKQKIKKRACLKLGIELTTKSKMKDNRNGTQYKRDNWTRRFIKVYFTSLGKVK